MQEVKRVIANLMTRGVSGLPADKMTLWRKELEDLVRLEEYYKIESETIEDLKSQAKGKAQRDNSQQGEISFLKTPDSSLPRSKKK
jgi:hypothetical protein